DFGMTGDRPVSPELLDWLASEFTRRKFSMKEMHRLIVTSEAYKIASSEDSAIAAVNAKIDPANKYLWRFPLKRMQAEIVRDLIYSLSGDLDLSVGGRSFREGPEQTWTGSDKVIGDYDTNTNRRGIYMGRGFHADAELLPAFLQVF